MTNTINQTRDFSVWLLGVTDVLARAAILVRIKRARWEILAIVMTSAAAYGKCGFIRARAIVCITCVTARRFIYCWPVEASKGR